MTETEYYKIRKKERIFYTILILVWIVAILLELTINFYNGYWIWIIAGTIIYLYLKDVFTGLKWSQKLIKPSSQNTGHNTALATMNDDEYKQYVEKNYPLVSAQEKNGYITLAQLCTASEMQDKLISFFENLRDFSKDEDYMTTLNYVMEYSDEQGLFFIMSLDYKEDVGTLIWALQNSLLINFALSIDFPKSEDFDKGTSVSYDNIFEIFDKLLRNNGLQIGFIDTQSDQYVIFVHKIREKEKVENAVNEIGYRYYEK